MFLRSFRWGFHLGFSSGLWSGLLGGAALILIILGLALLGAPTSVLKPVSATNTIESVELAAPATEATKTFDYEPPQP